MTQIYLIRHAETEGNASRMMQGQIDLDLTEKGRNQIKALTERFSDIHIDAVYSSDYYRTVETVKGISNPRGLDINVDVRLRERNLGAWDSNFFGDLEYAFPEKMKIYKTDPCQWSVEGYESYEEVTARMVSAFDEICRHHENKTIVIASHGVSIRCLMACIMGIPVTQIGKVPIGDNTSVSKLCISNDEVYFEYQGDTSHLSDQALFSKKVYADLRSEKLPSNAWNELCDISDLSLKEAVILLKKQNTSVIKLLDKETPVGVIAFEEYSSESVLMILYFYIMPQYRNKGFGTQMLGRAMRFARSKKIRYMATELSNAFLSIGDYFVKNGFTAYTNSKDDSQLLKKEIKYFSQESILPLYIIKDCV